MNIAFVSFALALLSQAEPQVSTPAVLRVGHVVEVRGALDEQGRFVAEKVELQPTTSDDLLLGTVGHGETDPARFTLLGQVVETDEQTKWKKLDRASLAGKRVEVEGSWKGPRKFRAESITPRGPGRDRIAARIDELHEVEGGYEARLMIFTLWIADGTEVEHELPVAEYALAPERKVGVPDAEDVERDEDDAFGRGVELTDTLRLSGQAELKGEYEDNYDRNDDDQEDQLGGETSLRLRLGWTPSEELVGRLEPRYRFEESREEGSGLGSESDGKATLGETWLQWRNVAGRGGFDLTVGRQDFDDAREWLYDENLDALRASWIDPDLRLDLSVATKLFNGSDRDEESWNAIAYLSNNDEDEHLAAWALFRETDEVTVDVAGVPFDLAETSLHLGLRALGQWIPQNEGWAELAFLTGDRDAPVGAIVEDFDVSAWAYDIGTTWSPPFSDPFYFTAGYAFGSGDSEVNESYRQTGYQDNNAKFGGVTSFSYYGELFEPELSNMGISTLGIGGRIAERTSLDLVFHTYTQDVAASLFSPRPAIEANLEGQPNGNDADLGWELDAVLGCRRIENWDIEIVAAMFEPGDGFDQDDTAYFGKLQIRYRF